MTVYLQNTTEKETAGILARENLTCDLDLENAEM